MVILNFHIIELSIHIHWTVFSLIHFWDTLYLFALWAESLLVKVSLSPPKNTFLVATFNVFDLFYFFSWQVKNVVWEFPTIFVHNFKSLELNF